MAKLNMKAATERVGQALQITGGIVASKYVKKVINGVGQGKINDKGNAFIRLGLGALIPSWTKSKIVGNVCMGILAEATTSLASSFGVPGLSGTEDDEMGDASWMSNTNEDWLSGTNYGDTLAGVDDDDDR